MPKAKSLKKTIDSISRKKHVISSEALKAKESIEKQKDEGVELSKDVRKQLLITEEFNHSVKLLISIFKESNFDELVMIVAHPSRVLVLNFFIGIIRGLGFAVGLILVTFLTAHFIQEILPPSFYHLLSSFFGKAGT